MAQTILVVDDEKDLAELLRFNLEQEGYAVLVARDGVKGLELARTRTPDLVLLDLMLPGMMGVEVCKLLRKDARTATMPVIMLTARGDEVDRVVGFEVGADDYVVKPFSIRELLLRIRAVLKRGTETTSKQPVITCGSVVIDIDRHSVTVDGLAVTLTTMEFRLLQTLAERRTRVQSRETLLQDVWGYEYVGDSRTVDTHVTRLRAKLGPAGDRIRTVRSVGYVMDES